MTVKLARGLPTTTRGSLALAALLLVALAPARIAAGYTILIAHADCGVDPASLRTQLLALDPTGTVDFFNGAAGTPTVAQMQGYNVVVAFSNCGWSDQTTMGNNLVSYVQAGGIVVAFNFDWYGGAQSLGGTWLSGGYSPFDNPGTVNFSVGTLGTYNAASPLMQGVTALSSYYRETLTVAAGATQVAAWNDGTPLIAVKGNVVGLSAYVGDYSDNFSGDFARVILNAAGGVAMPDLTIAKTHTGNFTQGQQGATYTITVTNSGAGPTNGTVTVTDTLPSGLTATSITGTGWTCTLGTLTCTRSDALGAGSSYPPITLTVDVSLTAGSPLTNTATVAGGGETTTTNDSAGDATTVDPAEPIPALSGSGLAVLALVLALVGFAVLRK